MSEIHEPQTPEQQIQRDLIARAMDEPSIADALLAFERAYENIPQTTVTTVTHVSYASGGNS